MLRWVWVSAIVIFLDQLTKWMANANLTEGEPVAVSSFLNMTLHYNTGAAFSMFAGQNGWQRWFFAILALVVSVSIIIWLTKLQRRERWTAIGLALVLGGAIGNLIDRMLTGKVIDFIGVHFPIPYINPDYHFAIFNAADIAITLGAALLIIISLFDRSEENN